MPPPSSERDAPPAFLPSTPVRSHSHSAQCTPQRSPLALRTPHKPLWPQESAAQHLPVNSFPLDPELGGPDVVYSHAIERGSSQGGFVPQSTSASPMSFVPPQYQHGGLPSPMHLFRDSTGMVMDPRLMQRTQSGPASHYREPGPQFLYYHQVPGPDQHPISWSTREAALRSPPAPRQRSAKACKKCRKRKTKCSGGDPCVRCVARGLECEYDEKSTLRGPKARIDSRSRPPPMASDTTGSDSSRASSRNEHRHHPYAARSPSRPPSGHMMERGSSQGGPAPQMSRAPQPYMLHMLGMAPGDMNTGYPTYGVRPMPEELRLSRAMEMSTMVDYAAATQMSAEGYPLAMPVMSQGGPMGWNRGRFVRSEEGDSSEGSRPGSACSGSSFNSSDGAYVNPASRSGVVWPTRVSDHFRATSIPPPLSACSSSSSLKDALVEVPRAGQASSAGAAPVPGRDPTPAEFTATLTNILSYTNIDQGDESPLLHWQSPSNSASGSSGSPADSGSSSAPSPITPSSPRELQFSDVFNLSPSTSGMSHSASIASVVAETESSAAWQAASPESTIRAKGDVYGLQSPKMPEFFGENASLNAAVSTSSMDLKTPRAIQALRFNYGNSASPPDFSSYPSHA